MLEEVHYIFFILITVVAGVSLYVKKSNNARKIKYSGLRGAEMTSFDRYRPPTYYDDVETRLTGAV